MTETTLNLTNEMIEKTNKKYIHNLNERINSNNGIIISCKYLNELYNSNNVSTNTFIEVILINLGGDNTKISLKDNSTIFQLAKILGNTLGISHDNLSFSLTHDIREIKSQLNMYDIISDIIKFNHSEKNIEFSYTTSETVCNKLVEKYNYIYTKTIKTGRTIKRGYGNYQWDCEETIEVPGKETIETIANKDIVQYMNQKWHKPPKLDQISPKVFKLCIEYFNENPQSISHLYDCCKKLYWKCFGVKLNLDYYIKLRTFTIEDTTTDIFPEVFIKAPILNGKKGSMSFACCTYNTFCRLFKLPKTVNKIEKNKLFQRWQQDCSILAQFIYTLSGPLFGATMRANAAIIDKTGILSFVVNYIKDTNNYNISPDVFAFIMKVVSDFSRRKMFTLDEQKQGKLNPFLQSIYECLDFENFTDIDNLLICAVLPSREHVRNISVEHLRVISNYVGDTLYELSIFLDIEMKKGALESLKRGGVVHSRRHGTNIGMRVNSTAWNGASGAFSNLYRLWLYIYEISPTLFSSCVLIPVRIPCLLAHDQFRWAQDSGKECDIIEDCKKIFATNFDPFGAILYREDPYDWICKFKKILKDNNIDEKRWIPRPYWDESGIAKINKHKQQEHEFAQPDSLVCGVAVPSGDAEVLKKYGVFGATQNTGT